MNYPVPDFGIDEDIIATQSHIRKAEKALAVDDDLTPTVGVTKEEKELD